MAATSLPWKEILKGATLVASLARDLIKHRSSRPNEIAETGTDAKSQLAGLAQRVEALETAGEEQARLLKMVAEEVHSLARRAMVGYWIGVTGLVVALGAVVVSLLR